MSTLIKNLVNVWLNNIQYALLPGACVLCGALSSRSLDLCPDCETDLPWLENCCQWCGLAFKEKLKTASVCGACLKQRPHFQSCQGLFHYEEPIKHLISHFKYHNKLLYGYVMSKLMAKKFAAHYKISGFPQVIIPVPLHNSRLRNRGYNQALELARVVAGQCAIPLDYRHLLQMGLSGKVRRNNLTAAFKIKPADYFNKISSVAIIDDVVTTATTANEIAGTLASTGVRNIDIWCIARA